uniref:peptidylprolyl isomerase n=1 Tax=Leersia perrieri TaxID=77586 RepID=A0A0D9WYZ0_9ORYZ
MGAVHHVGSWTGYGPSERLNPIGFGSGWLIPFVSGSSRRRAEAKRRGAAPREEEMELVSSSRSVLRHRGGVSAASSMAASARYRSKGARRFVCALGCDGVADGAVRRRAALALLLASPAMSVAFSAQGKTKSMNPYDERRLLQQNKKIQEANRAPDDFPNFIREGFEVKVVTSDNYITRDSGLMYEDIKVGTGNSPKDGQQVIFHYVGYNESGRRIDSTYIQGSPAKIRLGNKTLVLKKGYEI